MRDAGGYDGRCLFENLELVRTVRAAGGQELVAAGLYVRRLPPTARHFFSQRVRQAYDEFARPGRMAAQLTLLPLLGLLTARTPRLLGVVLLGSIALAEIGRRRAGGSKVFPFAGSLMAPLWLTERALCIWLALASRVAFGGVRYAGGTLSRAATPSRELEKRLRSAHVPEETAT
jgi:hypothetical protein